MSGGISPPVKSGIYLRAFSLVTLTMVMALGLALPSTSSAQGATRIGPIELLFAGTNPCNGEPFAGTARWMVIQYPLRVDGAGGMHNTVRILVHSQATTLAPVQRKYQANLEKGLELNAPSSGTIEATETINQVLVRQGEEQSSIPLASDDDFLFKQTFHFTFNSNGILTAEVLNGHQTCAGPPLGPPVITIP
jgi:hypothetical protein